MRTYSGLCVRGPLAGQMLTHVAPYYETIEGPQNFTPFNASLSTEEQKAGLSLKEQIDATTLEHRVLTYRHSELTIGGQLIELWCFGDDTVVDAIKHMAEIYHLNRG